MNSSSWTLLRRCATIGTGVVAVIGSTLYANTLRENNILHSKGKIDEVDPLSPKAATHFRKLSNAAVQTTVTVPDSASTGHVSYNDRLNSCIAKARYLCETVKDECGLPGLVVSVSVNGRAIWEEGLGYADLENRVKMTPDSVLRIASISKSMTAAMFGKLMEEGKIDIDLPIQKYIPKFPEKAIDGKKVEITTRHLLSHLSGIRHYKKKGEKEDDENNNNDEMDNKEYFLKDSFKTVEESLALFQADELMHPPGTKYYYTTHGFTVVSRIMEEITKIPFDKYSRSMFNTWGLQNTYLDKHEPLIYNRARCYTRTKKGRIVNSPYVDNSYKWAGGGFLSTVRDLTQFAHMLMYSYQYGGEETPGETNTKPNYNNNSAKTALSKTPYLKRSTVANLWKGDLRTVKEDSEFMYGLGFVVEEPFRKCAYCKESEMLTIGHSGGAIGASSILFIRMPVATTSQQLGHDEVDPCKRDLMRLPSTSDPNVQGLVIVMITNLTNVGLSKTAYEISNLFKWLI